MKLSTVLLLGLGVFVASCSADCNCKAEDQVCLNKCVMAANSCIVKCENKGDSCQQACISANWPAFAAVIQKQVLASDTKSASESLNTAIPTAMGASASMSGAVSMSASGVKPTMSAKTASTTMTPKNNNIESEVTSDSVRQTVGWSVALMAMIGTAIYTL